MPIRTHAIDGHPISLECIDRKEIIKGFSNLNMIKRVDKGPQFNSPNPLMLTMQKL